MLTISTPKKFGALISESQFIARGILRSRKKTVQLYEHGVVILEPKRETRLLFEEIEQFAIGKLSLYINGAGQGLNYYLEFWSDAGTLDNRHKFQLWMPGIWVSGERFFGFKSLFGLPLKYVPFNGNAINPTHDDTLELVRERLTELIARRMVQKFEDNQSVEWIPNVTISKFGLEFRDKQQAIGTCRFDQITDSRFDNNDLSIETSSPDLPSLVIQSGRANYYPGLELFRWAINRLEPVSKQLHQLRSRQVPRPRFFRGKSE